MAQKAEAERLAAPRGAIRLPARLLAVGTVILVAGCSSLNPFDAYRDLTGASKNDPPPDAPNTKNLAAGSDQPFPNLASVPPPPTFGLTEAERKALSDSLVADRTHARYSDEQLRAGTVDTVAAPRPPDASGKSPGGKSPGTKAPAATSPGDSATPAADTPPASATPASATPANAPAASAPPANAPPANAPTGDAQAGEDAAPSPASREASLTPPTARSVPVPEAPREPPPPPVMAPVPVVTPSPTIGQPPAGAADQAQGNQAGAPNQTSGTPTPSPQEALAPRAAPPTPAMSTPPNAAPPPQVNVGGKGAVTTPVTQVMFAPQTSSLSPFETAKLQTVPGQLRQLGGIVHVVGYASLPPGPADSTAALSIYQAAISRAEAVKQQLIKAGIPATLIQTEAAASPGSGQAGAGQGGAGQAGSGQAGGQPDRADIVIVH
ncbi:MAG TPA: hypothetical protein VNT30_13190 [Stellaceae bacterium]|nr:hypothetical protein [Stellaceae bacterium]